MDEEIDLKDYDGDFDAFLEACYQSYLLFWESRPTFEGKKVQRNKNAMQNGKETDFWGIVDGHDPDKMYDLDRYSKVPLLTYLLSEKNVKSGEDVLFYKRHHKGKIRVEIFSKSRRYLVVLQEIGKSEKLQFITAYPLWPNQLRKKIKNHKEYYYNGKTPL